MFQVNAFIIWDIELFIQSEDLDKYGGDGFFFKWPCCSGWMGDGLLSIDNLTWQKELCLPLS